MASPMVESRVDPHKKAQYSLHISDQIADGEVGDYTSVRFNHKPAQTTASRSTKITSTSPNDYTLRIEDQKPSDGRDVFIFTGQKTVPKRSYILVFDPASQKATLEPLANTYTFNVSTKNGIDMSSTYPKIYPRKQKDDAQDTPQQEDINDSRRDDVNITADAENPFDFRHFLSSGKDAKNGDESEYNRGTSSPDYRTGTGSAMNTPQLSARKPNSTTSTAPKTKAPASAKAAPKTKKPASTATVAKKPPPAVRLERRATTDPKAKPKSKSATAAAAPAKPSKPTKKAAAPPPSSKIKSAEIVHSSDDESDADDDAPPPSQPPPPQEPTQSQQQQRSPSPQPPPSQQNQTHSHDTAYDSDEEGAYDSDSAQSYDGGSGLGGLEIEFEDPDENSSKPRGRQQQQQRHPATAARLGYLNSPANGPISLASVASSVEGTPRTNRVKGRPGRGGIDDGVIDFDDFGNGHSDVEEEDEEDEDEEMEGGRDDVDVEPIDIGPPAARGGNIHGGVGNEEDVDADGDAEGDDGDMEDLLYKEVMEGLAGGDSSEESEEE